MAAFGLLFAVACLVVIGIGIVVGVVAAIACAALVALGILSSSAAIAFAKRSPSAGLLSLLLQVCAATGVAGGVGATLLGAALLEIDAPRTLIALSGATGGAAAGLGLGWLLHYCILIATRWLQAHVEIGTRR